VPCARAPTRRRSIPGAWPRSAGALPAGLGMSYRSDRMQFAIFPGRDMARDESLRMRRESYSFYVLVREGPVWDGQHLQSRGEAVVDPPLVEKSCFLVNSHSYYGRDEVQAKRLWAELAQVRESAACKRGEAELQRP